MRITVTIPLTVDVEFDTDGEDINSQFLEDDTRYAIMDVIQTDIVADSIVEAITEHTGWCISGLTMSHLTKN